MTKDEMVSLYYHERDEEANYNEAQRRIKNAMEEGKKYVYLPGKNSKNEFEWTASVTTIRKLMEDGFDIDKTWNPYEYWSIEWDD